MFSMFLSRALKKIGETGDEAIQRRCQPYSGSIDEVGEMLGGLDPVLGVVG